MSCKYACSPTLNADCRTSVLPCAVSFFPKTRNGGIESESEDESMSTLCTRSQRTANVRPEFCKRTTTRPFSVSLAACGITSPRWPLNSVRARPFRNTASPGRKAAAAAAFAATTADAPVAVRVSPTSRRMLPSRPTSVQRSTFASFARTNLPLSNIFKSTRTSPPSVAGTSVRTTSALLPFNSRFLRRTSLTTSPSRSGSCSPCLCSSAAEAIDLFSSRRAGRCAAGGASGRLAVSTPSFE
mmetsp:Transcript_7379/g.26979  ORF Transcript_7379/g.26979 Transcript_7379/m.26979 type:complete len:242 (+) Transcript_7379:610-1335(+)